MFTGQQEGGGPRVVVSTTALHAGVRGSVPGLGGLKETTKFESSVRRTVSSQSSHHPQEVLLAQFSLYVHKGGLKPDSFHLISSGQQDPRKCTFASGHSLLSNILCDLHQFADDTC